MRVPGVAARHPFLVQPQNRFNREDQAMKHVLSGTAIAVALVIAGPVWGQKSGAPMTPSSGAPSATSAPMTSMGSHARSHLRARRHATRHGRGGTSASDNVANQLNAQELARTGGGAPAPTYGRATGPYGQPNQVYGIPGAGQASPSPEYPSGPGPRYVPQYQVSPSPNAPAAR